MFRDQSPSRLCSNLNKAVIKTALTAVLLIVMLVTGVYAEEEEAYAPAINIYLSNAETGSGNASPGELTKVKAKVVYEGCVEGEKYTLTIRLEDTASGAICSFSDGTASLRQEFTAEGRAGFFDFEFEINAVMFSGRTLKEIHSLEGMEKVFESRNTDNNGKIYVPGMRTDAVSVKGEKTVLAGKNTVICDVVSYYGLAPGEEYRIVMGLKDTLTGEYIRGDDGNPVSSTSRFTPTEANGQVAARITANLREYGDRDITVCEDIYIVPNTGIPFMLLSNESLSAEYNTVHASLTSVYVLDELYRIPVAGAKLRVTTLSDGFTFEGVSDNEGKCSFPLDENEKCSCTVVSVPAGYNIHEGTEEFTPQESLDNAAHTVYLLKRNTIVLKRSEAETGSPLEGIVTSFYDQEGKKLSSVMSDETGKALFDANVYWSEAALAAEAAGQEDFLLTLYLKDTITPSDYFPRDEKWTVSIDKKGNISGLTDPLSYKKTTLTITIVDRQGNGIQGVEVTLMGNDGTTRGSAVTDPEGKLYFTPPKTGEYIMVETAVPSGYAGSARTFRFTVNEDGSVDDDLTITHISEEFATGIAAVIILTVVFAAVWFSTGFFVKRALKEKIKDSYDKLGGTGLHSK